jgi:NADH-quinone oxidoreductase subunit C
MSTKLEQLCGQLATVLGEKLGKLRVDTQQIVIDIAAADLTAAMTALRDDASLAFAQLLDVCGMDYVDYGGNYEGPRYAAVYHLLSVQHNWRVRVRAFCPDDGMPILDSMIPVWPSANWFEREAFDLYGIVFDGHPDLRRILTDYGFVGHPFRKDFPIYGNVEMRYDPEQKRVVYQPVTIEPREIVPRVIREEHYADRK